MGSEIFGIALLIAILVVSAVITQAFARWMYIVCPKCGTLNARRRLQCRNCGGTIRAAPPGGNSK
jgi:ribosomal protein S27E